jgi:hypothetical protein
MRLLDRAPTMVVAMSAVFCALICPAKIRSVKHQLKPNRNVETQLKMETHLSKSNYSPVIEEASSSLYAWLQFKPSSSRVVMQKMETHPLKANYSPAIKETLTLSSLIALLQPYGEGQSFGDRSALHETGSRRTFDDPQIWTHLFLLIAAFIGYEHKVYDLVLLLSIVTPLSIVYHINYEKPGLLAKTEGTFAKLLFVYGFAQLFHSPIGAPPILLDFEVPFMLITVGIFAATNLRKSLYDPHHCWMHIIPSIWASVVACYHDPLVHITF